MVRQFNKQPRDDSRSPSRNIPSSRYQEEQSSRPARPRLNRAMVDRGWENGTPRHHADYHPRMSNGQAPHDNRRKNQEAGNSSYHGSAGNRTNGNRYSQPNYGNQAQRRKGEISPFGVENNKQVQHSEPSSQSYSASRKQPFDSKGYNAEDRRFNNRPGDEPYSYNNRQAQDNRRRPQGRSSNFRTQEHSQGRSNDYGNTRPQPNRDHSNDYGNTRPYRNPERDKGKGSTSFNERAMEDRNQRQRESYLRPQSQPEAFQKQQGDRRSEEAHYDAPYREKFKGDYEHFSYSPPTVKKKTYHTKKYDKGNGNISATKSTVVTKRPSTGPKPSQRGFKWPKP